MTMTRQNRIETLLKSELNPSYLAVINHSSSHAHHAGDDGTGETHYDIIIASDMFAGKNRVARQRIVNNLLASEFDAGLHAVSMKIYSTDEYAQQHS